MKVAFFLNSLVVTGGVRCICEHARGLQERGHEVVLVVASPPHGLEFAPSVPVIRPRLRFQLYRAHRVLIRNGLSLVSNVPADYSRLLATLLLELGTFFKLAPSCDVTVATHYTTAWPVSLFGKGKGFYFMQHLEELFASPGPTEKFEKYMCRSTYSLPLVKLANSTWLRDQFRKVIGQEVPIVTNAVDVREFRPWDVPRNSRPRVVTFGKPIAWKGFEDAVQAVARVRQSRPDVEWIVYGYLPKTPPDNPIAPYKFVGPLLGDDLARLYSSADVVLCPSWYESFPLPPLEAMACAAAVVTTRPGTEDYAFDGSNSLVVPARDVKAMASAVLHLIENPRLRDRLREAGFQTARQMTWEKASANFETALTEAMRA